MLILIFILASAPSTHADSGLVTEWPASSGAAETGPAAPPPARSPAAPFLTPTPALPPPPTAIVPATPPPLGVAAAAPVLVHPSDAIAPPPRFGSAGDLVFDGSLSASFGYLGYSAGDTSSTSIGIQPSFDYFSSDGLFEGVSVFGRYSSGKSGIDISSRTISYGATVHVGPHFWLGERVSLWPRFSLGAWQNRIRYTGGFGGVVSIDGIATPIGSGVNVVENALFVDLFAPFLFHPAPHFFVGLGPDVFFDLVHSAAGASNRRHSAGASSTVGGWF